MDFRNAFVVVVGLLMRGVAGAAGPELHVPAGFTVERVAGAIQRWRTGCFHARAALLVTLSGIIGAWQGAWAVAAAHAAFPAGRVTLHQDLAGLDRVVAVES